MREFLRVITYLVLLLCISCSSFEFEARPGEYELLEYSLVEEETAYRVKLKILEVRKHPEWMPFLSFGIGDIKTQDKLEVFIQLPNNKSPELVTGYRYVVNDEIKLQEVIADGIKMNQKVEWVVEWDKNGEFVIILKDHDPIAVKTNLSNLLSFVRISGARGSINRYIYN